MFSFLVPLLTPNPIEVYYEKKLTLLFAFVAIFAIWLGCSENNSITEPSSQNQSHVEFGFTTSSQNTLSLESFEPQAPVSDFPNAKKIMVSITDENDDPTNYTDTILTLIDFSGEFITQSLPLAPGNYKLSKFIVLDENNQAIYATPLSGSSKAHLVSTPLPYAFSTASNQVSKVMPEVITTEGIPASEFGYTVFDFQQVEVYAFQIAAFAPTLNGYELTEADITISAGGVEKYSGALAAETNQILLIDEEVTYDFTISKNGYKNILLTKTTTELKALTTPLDVYFEAEIGGIDNYTVLNLSFESLPFTDDSDKNHTIVNNENGVQLNANGKFGNCAYFPGIGTGYTGGAFLYSADNEDWNFGSGEFTVDFWYKPINTFWITQQNYIGIHTTISFILWNGNGVNATYNYYNFPNEDYIHANPGTSLNDGNWHHVAHVRSGDTFMIFVDGIKQDETLNLGTGYSIHNSSEPLKIGWSVAAVSHYNGYLDELRISKGVARWTENFTPPSNPYTEE